MEGDGWAGGGGGGGCEELKAEAPSCELRWDWKGGVPGCLGTALSIAGGWNVPEMS